MKFIKPGALSMVMKDDIKIMDYHSTASLVFNVISEEGKFFWQFPSQFPT